MRQFLNIVSARGYAKKYALTRTQYAHSFFPRIKSCNPTRSSSASMHTNADTKGIKTEVDILRESISSSTLKKKIKVGGIYHRQGFSYLVTYPALIPLRFRLWSRGLSCGMHWSAPGRFQHFVSQLNMKFRDFDLWKPFLVFVFVRSLFILMITYSWRGWGKAYITDVLAILFSHN